MNASLAKPVDHALSPPANELFFRLSPVQRKVLSAIQFNGRLSIPEIAKLIRSKESNVRYALATLKAKGIIYASPLIDLSLIGYSYHTLNFSVPPKNSLKMNKIREFLSNCPQVVSACETGGSFQFSIVYATSSLRGTDNFFDTLEKKIGEVVREKQVATHILLADYRSDYLYRDSFGVRVYTWGASTNKIKLDDVDHRILASTTDPDFISLADTSRRLGIPLSTIEYRLRKLENEKFILGYRNLIRTEKLGAHRFWMTIVMRGSSASATPKFFDYCHRNPFIRFASRTVGAWDFEVSFDAPHAAAASMIVQNFHDEFDGQVASYNLIPVCLYHRVNTYPFIEAPASE